MYGGPGYQQNLHTGRDAIPTFSVGVLSERVGVSLVVTLASYKTSHGGQVRLLPSHFPSHPLVVAASPVNNNPASPARSRAKMPGKTALILAACAALAHARVAPDSESAAGKKEVYYPEYCHNTEPLHVVPLLEDAELLHVTLLHRHGDRGVLSSACSVLPCAAL